MSAGQYVHPMQIWGHFTDDADWTLAGYTRLCMIITAGQAEQFNKTIPSVTNALFFAMKNDIKPLWEDPSNTGSWSYKVHKKFSNQVWRQLIDLIGKGALGNDDAINGLSISPKTSFCIFKLFVNRHTKISAETMTAVNNIDWDTGMYKDI